MGTGLAIASLIVTAAGTGASIRQQRIAQNKQEQASALQGRQAEIANQRNIRRAIAASRADRANLVASGAAQTGGFDSSGLAGGAAAADTQLASNIGFARQAAGANRRLNTLNQGAATAIGRANTFGAIGALPGQFGVGFGDVLANSPQAAKNFGFG